MQILFWTFVFTVAVGRISIYRKRHAKPVETVSQFLSELESVDLISHYSKNHALRKETEAT